MAKSSVLTIRVPADLKHKIALIAEEQGVSINQLAMYMFAKEISNLEAGRSIAKYWKGYSIKEIYAGFDEVLKRIKDNPSDKPVENILSDIISEINDERD